MEEKNLSSVWDKTFKKDEKVENCKVFFHNRYGIKLVGDLYKPKKHEGKMSAIAICGPFGAVKEQASGLYAQELAKRGFLTLAFDSSFTGESLGEPRYMSSPDINTEDFQASIDYLSNLEDVDKEKIGIIGICGWGGLALNAAALDTRIKATAAITMYDMSRVNANGYFDLENSEEERFKKKVALNEERTKDYLSNNYPLAGGVIDPLPIDAPQFVKDYYAYYKTKRGYHSRSLNSNGGWTKIGTMSFLNQPIMSYINEIRSAVLIIHGEKAHSLYFGKDAYEKMITNNKYKDNKELMIIPGANHTDLYDGGNNDYIPFNKIENFFKSNFGK